MLAQGMNKGLNFLGIHVVNVGWSPMKILEFVKRIERQAAGTVIQVNFHSGSCTKPNERKINDLGFCVLKQNTLNRPFSAFARVTRAHGCLEIELV